MIGNGRIGQASNNGLGVGVNPQVQVSDPDAKIFRASFPGAAQPPATGGLQLKGGKISDGGKGEIEAGSNKITVHGFGFDQPMSLSSDTFKKSSNNAMMLADDKTIAKATFQKDGRTLKTVTVWQQDSQQQGNRALQINFKPNGEPDGAPHKAPAARRETGHPHPQAKHGTRNGTRGPAHSPIRAHNPAHGAGGTHGTGGATGHSGQGAADPFTEVTNKLGGIHTGKNSVSALHQAFNRFMNSPKAFAAHLQDLKALYKTLEALRSSRGIYGDPDDREIKQMLDGLEGKGVSDPDKTATAAA